ncbi:mycoredoxin [Hoyosella altamirensis]|uniref:Mycoredoxin n=2 Tax=Hoyosella altamirensis TaxID=616997 RepID=A0A839RH23_9ACTN|nr:mycoredoxin [Hoyosella altamirensis]
MKNPTHRAASGMSGLNKWFTLSVTDVAVSQNSPITVYSTTWCGYCIRLKKQLSAAGIAYEEVDIEFDQHAADFVGRVNNGNHVVPTVKFPNGATATNPSLAQVKQILAN